MSQNPQPTGQPPVPPLPQQPPGTLGYANAPPRTDLYTIATRQKAIMYCILGYLGCGVLSMVTPFPIKAIFSLANTGDVHVFPNGTGVIMDKSKNVAGHVGF